MGLVNMLVQQSGHPRGILGRLMLRMMNRVDSGLNSQVKGKIHFPNALGLEVGCGGGAAAHGLLIHNHLNKIIGIDASDDSIHIARNKNKHMIDCDRAEFFVDTVESLSFSNEHFEVVYAVRSHYFWHDLEKAFEEIYRVMKKKGKLFIFSERYKVQHHLKEHQNDYWMEERLRLIGFTRIKIENTRTTQCITAVKY